MYSNEAFIFPWGCLVLSFFVSDSHQLPLLKKKSRGTRFQKRKSTNKILAKIILLHIYKDYLPWPNEMLQECKAGSTNDHQLLDKTVC